MASEADTPAKGQELTIHGRPQSTLLVLVANSGHAPKLTLKLAISILRHAFYSIEG